MNLEIQQGDCIKKMNEIEDNTVDLVITSPPYNIGIEYDVYDDKKSWKDYYLWCFEWMKEILRVLKPDGRACIIHYLSLGNAEFHETPLMEIKTIADEIGFKYFSTIIWEDKTLSKNTAWGSWLSASSPYISSPYEAILVLYKKQWKKQKQGKSTIEKEEFISGCSGVWNIPTEKRDKHPAPFPVALAKRCINLLSYEGDFILDPFLGSGSTLIACKETNRNGLGIEISKTYCEIAQERLNLTQKMLF